MEKWVIVGLGNPGEEYAKTRHNIGEMIVRHIAKHHGLSFTREKSLKVHLAKLSLSSVQLHFVLPISYMNESGLPIRRYLDYTKIVPEKMLVIVDDADLSFGELRLRSKGGTGGHNGLKSIQQAIGTQEYPRLRVGIGREIEGRDLADHVLSDFTAEENNQFPHLFESVEKILLQLNQETFSNLMNQINEKMMLPKRESK